MRPLVGPVRDYAWGSHIALASLQGRPTPTARPEAELWLGAHPSAPAEIDGRPLTSIVAADPAGTLGEEGLARFGPRLPYLLKLLAAAQPLSLQAHPDADQARLGHATDPANYVDPYHKPEILVALEPFDALCGFRAPTASAEILAGFGVAALDPLISRLGTGEPGVALRGAVELIMDWPTADRSELVAAVAGAAERIGPVAGAAVVLAGELGRAYPGDMGVVLALLLNQVQLQPDEAVFMPAGNLHAYLRGFGVELMAASDNVLRGGLTPKRVDVPELLRVLRYDVLADPVVRAVSVSPGLLTWPTPVSEFALVKGSAAGPESVLLPGSGARIVVCVGGPTQLSAGGAVLRLAPGEAAFVAASEPAVRAAAVTEIPAVVFQAAPA